MTISPSAGTAPLESPAALGSEELFRLLVDAVQDYAIFMLDTEGHVMSWNKGAQRAKGYTRDEILGRYFSIFYTPEDLARHKPRELLQIAREKGRVEDEGWRVRKDGTRFWADVIITAVYDSQNRLRGFAKVTRDMTERRAADTKIQEQREQIGQLQKMEAIGRLTGGVAHDFNNLIIGILGCSEALGETAGLSVDAQTEITEIKKACHRASVLVRQLMAFSRRQIAVPKIIQVNQVIQDIDKLLRRMIPSTIDIQFDLEPDLPVIKMDSNQLEQILINLVVNARDAMPDGGRLQIQTRATWVDDTSVLDGFPRQPGKAVLLAISDTGTGMSIDVQKKIFEPFFTTKEAGKGSGLGLATVYGIVQQNDGGISVHSQTGMGSTFKIFLPLPDPGETAGETAREAPPDDTHLRGTEVILLVEDEPLVLRNTVRSLQSKGYTVLSASNAEEALPLFEKIKSSVRLLITDIVMPGITGKELAERIKKEAPNLPVLFISGYAQEIIATRGLLAPDIALLEKPFSSLQLAERVRELLNSTS